MKTTSLALSLAAAALANAQSDEYYNITSAPFHLVVSTANGSINDTLTAFHTGAAIESLGLSNSNTTSHRSPSQPSAFNFNTSIYSTPPTPGFGTPGILTWFLNASSIGNIPSSVTFSYDPTTDIAVPILNVGSENPQILAFNAEDQLVVQGYVDWSADPPNGTANWKEYSRWYACNTYYSSYQYQTLAWGLGPGKPENPSCTLVNVTRVFV